MADLGDTIRAAVEAAIAGARCQVTPGNPGHYALIVTSPAFAGLNRVAAQRLVYGAIAHLMKGADAPLHAVDSLTTRTE
jgi:acid stress-induced BolA-like protein IbaG/YrbA